MVMAVRVLSRILTSGRSLSSHRAISAFRVSRLQNSVSQYRQVERGQEGFRAALNELAGAAGAQSAFPGRINGGGFGFAWDTIRNPRRIPVMSLGQAQFLQSG